MPQLRSSLSHGLQRFRTYRAATAPRRQKRMARMKVGLPWVFAAGFAVLLGLFIYVISASKLRHVLVAEVSVADPRFRDFAGPLLGAEFLAGNTITPLINGVEIFPSMLAAIAAAEKSITLESYIWASGEVSDRFSETLIERARQGVKIHLLVDGVGNLRLKFSDINRMKEVGIEFVVYGREHWYQVKLDLNHRSHRKILIVDGTVGFTGGVCIDDAWMGDADDLEYWRETQARITGPVVGQMQAVFATNWLQSTSRLLTGPDYFPEPVTTGDAIAHCYMSGPGERPENARLSYLLAIASARHSIQLAHAYFLPDDLSIDMLLAARRRGVRIEVIVPAQSDSRIGLAIARSRWDRLLAGGVEFHEYLPSLYHCKMMIVDDVYLTIGSVNFDNRSFSINDEVNITVIDRDTARRFQQSFTDDLTLSAPLSLQRFRDRPWYVKVADHGFGLFRAFF
jgi:cardiolipin synthase A/B